MDEYDSRTGPDSNRSASSSELDTFQRDLARQLAGVDEQTFQKVKQAIQTVLNQRQESTHQQSLIEVCHTLMVGHASYPYCLKPQGFEATGRTRGLCVQLCAECLCRYVIITVCHVTHQKMLVAECQGACAASSAWFFHDRERRQSRSLLYHCRCCCFSRQRYWPAQQSDLGRWRGKTSSKHMHSRTSAWLACVCVCVCVCVWVCVCVCL